MAKKRTRKAHLDININGKVYKMTMDGTGAVISSTLKARNNPEITVQWSSVLGSAVLQLQTQQTQTQ